MRAAGPWRPPATRRSKATSLFSNCLREEVCVKRNKVLFYRTWDFGQFHDRPDFYLKVTNADRAASESDLLDQASAGDFHRLSRFNPTLGIGKHRQIVEVCCQLDCYGKGAHPYYNGQGVIDGWEEYAWTMKPGQPKGLRDIVASSDLCGRVHVVARRRLGGAVSSRTNCGAI